MHTNLHPHFLSLFFTKNWVARSSAKSFFRDWIGWQQGTSFFFILWHSLLPNQAKTTTNKNCRSTFRKKQKKHNSQHIFHALGSVFCFFFLNPKPKNWKIWKIRTIFLGASSPKKIKTYTYSLKRKMMIPSGVIRENPPGKLASRQSACWLLHQINMAYDKLPPQSVDH